MSRTIVLSLQGPFLNAYGLLRRFIEECPDAILKETNGGWPVWQQLYHALSAIDSFCRAPGDTPPARPFDQETGLLLKVSDACCTREALLAMADEAKALADAYFDRTQDSDLTGKNVFISGLFGMDVTHASTFSMLAGHTFYHLGSCDAALRDHGLKGVF